MGASRCGHPRSGRQRHHWGGRRRWKRALWPACPFGHLPTTQVGVAARGHGISDIGGLAGVESVGARVRLGAAVDWREGTCSCLSEVSGWAQAHDGAIQCAGRVEDLSQVRVVLA
jgi:hypothetical protein